MARKGLSGALMDAGTRFVSRAADRVLKDPRGEEVLARAVGLAQRGRRRLSELQERVLSTAGVPGRRDYEELARQLARIKRKARELGQKLDPAGRDGADETR
ncbi:MAG TPA: hypothetical protein VEB43_04510 [Anaeromyxobacter sp.]|nr:hypothetical protein [Anaeromyxobacter sp.]